MNVHIKLDDLSDYRIAKFLEEHIEDMRAVSPPESTHALDLDGLRTPDIAFWSAWAGESLVGCVAIKRLNETHCELKSMRTSAQQRKQGIGKLLLQHAHHEQTLLIVGLLLKTKLQ